MKQVFLSGKGHIEVFDVPLPGRLYDAVLVRNAYSLISTGTEAAAVITHGGWLGVYEKVRDSKERFTHTIVTMRSVGRTTHLVTYCGQSGVTLGTFCPAGYRTA